MRATAVVCCLSLVVTVGAAEAHIRPGNLWTAEQAESIRFVRGTPISGRHCEGGGEARTRRGTALYRHFACSGWTAPKAAPVLKTSVWYTLHPLGTYVGGRSGYIATDARFIGPGVP